MIQTPLVGLVTLGLWLPVDGIDRINGIVAFCFCLVVTGGLYCRTVCCGCVMVSKESTMAALDYSDSLRLDIAVEPREFPWSGCIRITNDLLIMDLVGPAAKPNHLIQTLHCIFQHKLNSHSDFARLIPLEYSNGKNSSVFCVDFNYCRIRLLTTFMFNFNIKAIIPANSRIRPLPSAIV
jgi:hypothetical protein